jgi:uncharacterized cupin superfamily protein
MPSSSTLTWEFAVTSCVSLLANHAVHAASMALEYQDLPVSKIVSGAPRVGTAELGKLGESTIGVWEMPPSVSTDTEVDEFFIVLSGSGTVAFDDGSPEMNLQPGTVGHLRAGSQTTWTITSTLRKIYVV